MADIFQIEHKILAPADGHIHAQAVFLHNLSAVQLVPEYAVIKIRRIFHHMRRKLLSCHYGILFDVPFLGQTFSHNPVKISDHQIAAVLLGGTHEQLGSVRRDPVVAVEKLKIGSPRPVNGLVAAVGYSGVFLVDHTDPGVLFGVTVTDAAAGIRAAVIDQQKLKIRIFLVQDAVNAACKMLFGIVYRNNNTYGWGHGCTLLYCRSL